MTHITVTPDDPPVVIVQQEEAVVVTAVREGPQGPPGPAGPSGATELSALTDVDVSGKTAKSLLYYDAASGKWIGDSIQTIIEVTNGGNF